ncbi:MAG: outer membrane beta-barrel protein [Bacteroidales bacterium]|nr:outer membrane beta-barrel protein [Bacteroidales bacterium]
MKDERNNMDELFSEGLGDFSPAPPTELWERIEATLPAPVPVNPHIPANGSSRLVTIGIAAAVITGLALLWFLNSNTEPKINNTSIEQVTPTNDITIIPAEPVNPGGFADKQESTGINSSTRRNKSGVNDIENEAAEDSFPFGKTENENTSNPASVAENTIPEASTTLTLKETQQFLQSEPSENTSLFTDLRPDFIFWLNSHKVNLVPATAGSAFSNHFKTSLKPAIPKGDGIPLIGGVYASLDMIDYGNGHSRQSRSAGISLSTFKGPWIIETGAAFCMSDDNGRYMINYNSWDSLGFYNKVISFSPQPDGTIHFDTEVQGVYDSIDHRIETKTRNRYTYMQIPLMAGYRVYSNRILTISLKAGPIFSVMLASDEPGATFSENGTNLQSIENLSPSRLSTDWQVAAGLGLGFYLSRRFTFLAEPTYKTYLRPVYRNHNIRPQSIGIKAGLLYRF